MEDKYIEKFHNGMSKADRDKIAQRCFIYDKYFEMFKKFIRFKAVELQDINTGYIKARDYYRYKMSQVNAIAYTLKCIYADNNYYSLDSRDLFAWSIDLLSNHLRDYIEFEYNNICKDVNMDKK